MKINIRVIPRASKNKIEYFDDQKLLKVWTIAAPVDGEANKAVIAAVSKYLDVSKNCVQIISGNASKNKIIEIVGDIGESDLIKKPRLL